MVVMPRFECVERRQSLCCGLPVAYDDPPLPLAEKLQREGGKRFTVKGLSGRLRFIQPEWNP